MSDEIEIKEGVTIESSAFSKTNISKVTIGNNITLPIGSFDNCPKLENIIIGDNVTIQASAWSTPSFSSCSNIKNVTMGNNIKMNNTYNKLDNESTGWIPFYKSKVEKMTIESLSEVGTKVFYNVGPALQGDMVINEGVTKIGAGAFNGCSNITSASIPSTVTEIGNTSFYNCTNLKTAKLPEAVKKINWRSILQLYKFVR